MDLRRFESVLIRSIRVYPCLSNNGRGCHDAYRYIRKTPLKSGVLFVIFVKVLVQYRNLTDNLVVINVSGLFADHTIVDLELEAVQFREVEV